jgi:hypothetical protein
MIVINVDIMICIMCDVLLLKCASSVVLMFKYVLCIKININKSYLPSSIKVDKNGGEGCILNSVNQQYT